MNVEKIKKQVKEEEISYILLQFINLNGQLQAVEKPISQLNKIIANEVMIDGSSIKGYTDIQTSDLFLLPDWKTYMKCSFLGEGKRNIARVICNIIDKEGNSFMGDPRNILQAFEKDKLDKGYTLAAAFEAEFFLLKKDDTGKLIPADNAGYFGISPFDTAHEIKREMADVLEKHGYIIEAFHKEVAKGQHEINYQYSNAITAADQIVTFKWIIRTIAHKYNLVASFMPKPFHGMNGSGMHTNISVFKNGKNIFARESIKNITNAHKKFISGLMRRAKEMAAITNPTVNSYKRLIPGYEAPNSIAWSDSNRSSVYRVPASIGNATRIEKRNVDPTANPYLALSIIFAAGFEGLNSKVKPYEAVYENLFNKKRAQLKEMRIELLPDTLGMALEIMSKSNFIKSVLGSHTFEKFLKEKYGEWDEYREIVHTWEKDKYNTY